MPTEGRRVYAVGDIHGCLHKLKPALDRIEADLASRPHARPTMVFLGDYGDRGVQTRGVIERLIALARGPWETVFLRGNHDVYLIDYLAGRSYPPHWPRDNMGGTATLASYGVGFEDGPEAARNAVPAGHRAFLEATVLWHRLGDYLFVHAGTRPGVPLERQEPEDLLWIREPFLSATEPHEGIVVHGHTPVKRLSHYGNRIAVDTGAVFGGPLSVLVLEDDRAEELGPEGRAPVFRP